MRIAIPVANEVLCAHFGHCDRSALVEIDPAKKQILGTTEVEAPPHEPGLLPPWLADRGANVIIAGGMGERARALFQQQHIDVIVGAPVETPEHLVIEYLSGTLQAGDNSCDH